MTSNYAVARAWANGYIASSNRMWTDGSNLYSYALKIGLRYAGENLLINYMGRNMYSMTTSHHVSLAKQVADRVIDPDSFEFDELRRQGIC